MIKFRDYQIEAIKCIKDSFKKMDRQYIEMPTGSGKTVTFLSYAKENHNNILIIVPSKELLRQVYETCLLFFSKDEISRKGSCFDEPISKVHICIINSVRGKYLENISRHNFDLTIIDEAHHTQSRSYVTFIAHRCRFFPSKEMKILGVTATPDRLDGKFIKDIIGNCTFEISLSELINQGYISDIEGLTLKTDLNISDVTTNNGDFSLNKLFKKLENTNRNELILEIYKKEMKDRKTVVFCINIEHSKTLCKLFNANGVASHHIDGTMKSDQRSSILSSFRNSDIQVLFNCQMLTEGFDEPSITGIILARPTVSKSLFIQMIGRGLRISPGKKNCKVIDVVDNYKNLAGFESLSNAYQNNGTKPDKIQSFNGIKNLNEKAEQNLIKVKEWTLQQSDFIKSLREKYIPATEGMVEYLQENKIVFFHPISFDQASFLIWHDKLKKEYLYEKNK